MNYMSECILNIWKCLVWIQLLEIRVVKCRSWNSGLNIKDAKFEFKGDIRERMIYASSFLHFFFYHNVHTVSLSLYKPIKSIRAPEILPQYRTTLIAKLLLIIFLPLLCSSLSISIFSLAAVYELWENVSVGESLCTPGSAQTSHFMGNFRDDAGKGGWECQFGECQRVLYVCVY